MELKEGQLSLEFVRTLLGIALSDDLASEKNKHIDLELMTAFAAPPESLAEDLDVNLFTTRSMDSGSMRNTSNSGHPQTIHSSAPASSSRQVSSGASSILSAAPYAPAGGKSNARTKHHSHLTLLRPEKYYLSLRPVPRYPAKRERRTSKTAYWQSAARFLGGL
ncbi:hypothetical protein BS17DRAFT_475721 [Gyrodon lividus]|nr:hypothetical protein BS17DRAFT_475721 [Gyrodon lividus]